MRVTLFFSGFIYMLGRVIPYMLGRVTILGGIAFYHVNGRGRVTRLRGTSFRPSHYIRAIGKHGFAW